MRLGYLHIGHADHGIRRYGEMLAAEAHRVPTLSVVEATLPQVTRSSARDVRGAVKDLNSADLVHIQYSPRIWGTGRAATRHLRRFLKACKVPIVATLHDVYLNPDPSTAPASSFINQPAAHRTPWSRSRASLNRWLNPTTSRTSKDLNLAILAGSLQAGLMTSEVDALALRSQFPRLRVRSVPHFVERRSLMPARQEARTALGLDDSDILLTLLGYIHGRKGHKLAVESLPLLPPSVKLVFAGRAAVRSGSFHGELLRLASKLKVTDRLTITGYLDDAMLELYLTATDLALCPFKRMTGSGSLSTWIAVGRRVLAYDLPQIREYNSEGPAIYTFDTYTPEGLADGISRALAGPNLGTQTALENLQNRLAISRIFELHLQIYRTLTDRADRGLG